MSKQSQNLFAYIVLIPMKNEELFMYYSLSLGSNGLIALRGIADVDPNFLGSSWIRADEIGFLLGFS